MMRNVRTAAIATAVLGLLAGSADLAFARTKSGSKASQAESAPASEADASLARARRALDEGKAETALELANAVLMSGAKDSRGTARALAIRGEAYLRQGRSVQALADLESALWVKDGLSGREREQASVARSTALQRGGISTAALPPARPSSAAGTSPPERHRSAAPEPVTMAPIQPPGDIVRGGYARPPEPVRPEVYRTEAPQAVQRAPRAVVTGWGGQVQEPARPQALPPPSPQRGEAPVVAASAPKPWSWTSGSQQPEPAQPSGGGISGFFSNLFGGNSGSDVSTGSVSRRAEVAPPPRAAEVSSSFPQRATAAPQPSYVPVARPAQPRHAPVHTAAIALPASPAPASQSQPAGKVYRLQLAAVRSREEAVEMEAKVRSEDRGLVGSRQFEIAEDVYGNMGRFYRVRIGPFTEITQALSVCASLRDRRIDCMVLDH